MQAILGRAGPVDDFVIYGCRLVIPNRLRPGILKELHESHQGIVRTKQRAQLAVYWPGIDNDIENVISSCVQCQACLPSHPQEPIVLKPVPERPFQELAVDSTCTFRAKIESIELARMDAECVARAISPTESEEF